MPVKLHPIKSLLKDRTFFFSRQLTTLHPTISISMRLAGHTLGVTFCSGHKGGDVKVATIIGIVMYVDMSLFCRIWCNVGSDIPLG